MSTKLTNVITLSELSRFKTNLDTVFATKVDKVAGKGLSANDFTNDLKSKLDAIASGAQVNVIESISVNGTAQTITNKGVDITMPTALTDLTNDGNFVQDASYVHTDNNYTDAEKSKLANVAPGATKVDVDSTITDGGTNPVQGGAIYTALANKTDQSITGANGTSLVFNEGDGGGAKFEHSDGTWSFVGVNDGGEDGITGQIYTVQQYQGKYVGTRLNMTLDGFYYLPDSESSAYTADDEIATKGDVIAGAPVASDTNPLMDGTAAPGTGTTWSRADHVHPTDTSRAPLASPALTGIPTAPTATAGTNTTQIATTEFVTDAISTAVSSVYTVKGSKADIASLPSSGNKKGDVWHVEDDGSEYFWTGTKWEFMGKVVDVSGFVSESDITIATNAQIDALFAAA